MPVPQALVQATRDFQTSIIRQQWQRSNVASRGSVCQISFRIVNLGAVFANGEITDLGVIRDMALEIDRDLEAWREGAPSGWAYTRIDASEATPGTFFDTHIHVYPSLWIAEAWNNWRALRIVVNKIIHQCEACSDAPRDARQSAPLSIIQELSTDMCISISSFMGTPRGSFGSSIVPRRLIMFHRHPVPYPTTLCCGSRGAKYTQHSRLCRGAITQYWRGGGNSAGWSAGYNHFENH